MTIGLVVSRQATGIPNMNGGSDCQWERKGISRLSRCFIVWFANRNFGLIYFVLVVLLA